MKKVSSIIVISTFLSISTNVLAAPVAHKIAANPQQSVNATAQNQDYRKLRNDAVNMTQQQAENTEAGRFPSPPPPDFELRQRINEYINNNINKSIESIKEYIRKKF